jgi:hypothetical protein
MGLWRPANPDMAGMAGRLETREWRKVDIMLKVGKQNSPFSSGSCSFFFSKPSTNRIRPTHVTEGNLLYSKCTVLISNLI